MQCSEIEQLLYLHRKSELNPKEEATVSEHLETCSACQKKRMELSQMDSVFEVFRGNTLTTGDSGQFVSNIMASVSPGSGTGGVVPSWLTERLVRITLAAIIGLLAATFVAEQAITLEKIASLEAKMSQQVNVGTATGTPLGRLATLYSGMLEEPFQAYEIKKYQSLFDKMKSRKISVGQKILRLSTGNPLIDQEKIQHLLRGHSVGKSGIELLKLAYRFSVQEGTK